MGSEVCDLQWDGRGSLTSDTVSADEKGQYPMLVVLNPMVLGSHLPPSSYTSPGSRRCLHFCRWGSRGTFRLITSPRVEPGLTPGVSVQGVCQSCL